MKVYLASLEISPKVVEKIIENKVPMKLTLNSFWYIRQNIKNWERILDYAGEVLVDSGAFTMQKQNQKVDEEAYIEQYIEFIKKYDCDKITGFFELDIDNVVGYEKVKEYRARMHEVTDKVIPVWHSSRGVEEFTKMCQEYAGKIVAVKGFKNEEIKDNDFILFLKEAWKYDCKLHVLGMTRRAILNKYPFDMVDSSSWSMYGAYGMKVGSGYVEQGFDSETLKFENYKHYVKDFQEHYWKKHHRTIENKKELVSKYTGKYRKTEE